MGVGNAWRPTSTLLCAVLLWVGLLNVVGYGQVQLSEIALTSQTVEPSAGARQLVFSFNLKDVDPLSNDGSPITMTCFVIQNLGTALPADITEISLKNTSVQTPSATTAISAPSSVPATANCPQGAPAGGSVSFEAFLDRTAFDTATDFDVADDGSITVEVSVKVANSLTLGAASQNHTLVLRAVAQFSESVGSPAVATAFSDVISDSAPDRLINAGINELQVLGVPNESIEIGAATSSVVASFKLCDSDANALDLKLPVIRLAEGPLGNALSSDIFGFELVVGGVSAGTKVPDVNFNPGGSGFDFVANTAVALIPDDTCKVVDIKALIASTAPRGRKLQLNVTFFAFEGETIVGNVAPSAQVAQTVILGNGIISIPDTKLSGDTIPIQISGFPLPGLGQLDVQTASIRFDPSVVGVIDILPQSPYKLATAFNAQDPNLRAGLLKFSLKIDPAQTPSAQTNAKVALIKVVRRGQPGDQTLFVFQADRVLDAANKDLTTGIIFTSGTVTLLNPGDLDSDGQPTVRDALRLARYILSFCLAPTNDPTDNLTSDQKKIADVAAPLAATGTIPGCAELTSADVRQIAKLAINFGIASLPPSLVGAASPAVAPTPLSWWQRLLRRLMGFKPSDKARLTLNTTPTAWTLDVSSKRALGALQGRVLFDPQSAQVTSLVGLNGYDIVAEKIDNVAGEVRFAVLNTSPQASTSAAILGLNVRVQHDLQPRLQLDIVLDARAEDLPFTSNAARTVELTPLRVSALRLAPQRGARWQLNVEGQGIASTQIEGFDLAGVQRFGASAPSDSLLWSMLNRAGQPLANGVYLYVVSVRGVNGEVWRSPVRKLVVLR